MTEITSRFLGFLSNCDESILEVKFGNGYEIKKLDFNNAILLIDQITGKDQMDSAKRIITNALSLDVSGPVYYIEREESTQISEGSSRGIASGAISKIGSEGSNYFYNRIRLMRLFKQGNLMMPMWYSGIKGGGKMGPSMRVESGNIVTRELYHLDREEIPTLMRFLDRTLFPFKDEVLQTSFDLFELSYSINNWPISFITCIIGIENLLNPDITEVKHRVSRNLAVLIGKDKQGVAEIYQEMKKIYDKRSKIAHGRGSKEIVERDVMEARDYLREAIKSYYCAGLDKDSLMKKLNELGFDDVKSWIE